MAKTLNLSSEDSRERIFLEIIYHLGRYTDSEKRAIAEEAEVHWVTLYAWSAGRTIKPRIDTLARVARALGYDIVLKRVNSRPPSLRIVK